MKASEIQEKITQKFIEAIEKDGMMPWQKPWNDALGNGPRNYNSNKVYQGYNWIVTAFSEFKSPFWLTFEQAKKLGGMVKKGSKGTTIFFWDKFVKKTGEKNAKGEDVTKSMFFLKSWTIFNAEQIDGIEFKQPEKIENLIDRCEIVDGVLKNMHNPPKVEYGGNRACYSPLNDKISMPELGQFKSKEHFYATLVHEYMHSTGHVTRLKREGVTNSDGFGREIYSFEELVAEIGSAMFLSQYGMQNESIEANQNAYVKSWIRVLKNDPQMIFKAASQAQKAVGYIHQVIEETEEIEA